MGKMKIKKTASSKKYRIPYNQELEELKEWQENQYNPGHYIGTGRIPYGLKMLSKNPKLKKAYLLFILGPMIIMMFFTKINWLSILFIAAVIAIVALIAWDSKRYLKKKGR